MRAGRTRPIPTVATTFSAHEWGHQQGLIALVPYAASCGLTCLSAAGQSAWGPTAPATNAEVLTDRFPIVGKPEVEPSHPHAQQSAIYASSGSLATNLPLFPGRLQLLLPFRVDLLLPPAPASMSFGIM
jgi:hypothetical protein